MNIDAKIIYAAIMAIVAALVALWRKFEKSHDECIKERKECQDDRKLLIDHTVAQQHDILMFSESRKQRGVPSFPLQSERTQFFKKHIEPKGEGI